MNSLTRKGDRVKNLIRSELAIPSTTAILFHSFIAGISMLGIAIFLQWLIYFNWMEEPGSLEIAGSIVAGVLMFILVFRSQFSTRQRATEMVARLKTIRWMNDRIRNSLQAIECVTYAASPEASNEVQNAVNAIENILEDFLTDNDAERTYAIASSEDSSAISDARAGWSREIRSEGRDGA